MDADAKSGDGAGVLTQIPHPLFELPATVDMTVVETEPGLKGATVSNVTKPAKMETGLMVQVPPFITEGEKIRVNTAEGTYQERA